MSDQTLLREFAADRCEAAFAALVQRHVNLVFGTACRQLGSRSLAEEVSQHVFLMLARKAGSLGQHPTIAGWLHQATLLECRRVLRTELRRQRREQEAVALGALRAAGESVWASLVPLLDEAMLQLSEKDRLAVLLRFLEEKPLREVGEALGGSEDAAQKRVARALSQMTEFFRQRGFAVPALTAAAPLFSAARSEAPMALAGVLSTKAVAAATGPIAPANCFENVFRIMAHLKPHPLIAALAALVCLSVGTAGFIAGKAGALRRHAWAASHQAGLYPQPELPAARAPALPGIMVSGDPPATAQPLSVGEILAQAAQHFRSLDTDPEARSKGLVVLERLRAGDATEALRQLQRYQSERAVYEGLAPPVLALWAETEPRAALEYALTNFQGHTLVTSLEGVSRAWAREQPDLAWAWYRETRDSAQPPALVGVAAAVFTEWAEHEAAGAFGQLSRLDLADEKAAVSGIADAVRNPVYRPAILAGLAELRDGEQRQRLASAIARNWAESEPQAATEWAASLPLENPAAGLRIALETFGEWWEVAPDAAAKWALRQGPPALREEIKHRMPAEEFAKFQEAGR